MEEAPSLAGAVAVTKRLNELLRRKSEENLDKVLADAAGTPLQEFAANLRRDLSAVQASLNLPWTTSPAEGQINRLKMLKRTCMAALALAFFARASCTPRNQNDGTQSAGEPNIR